MEVGRYLLAPQPACLVGHSSPPFTACPALPCPQHISTSRAISYVNVDRRALIRNDAVDTGASRYFNWLGGWLGGWVYGGLLLL